MSDNDEEEEDVGCKLDAITAKKRSLMDAADSSDEDSGNVSDDGIEERFKQAKKSHESSDANSQGFTQDLSQVSMSVPSPLETIDYRPVPMRTMMMPDY
jgi:hypothetical protein